MSIQEVFDKSPEGFENKCEFSKGNATKRGDWGDYTPFDHLFGLQLIGLYQDRNAASAADLVRHPALQGHGRSNRERQRSTFDGAVPCNAAQNSPWLS